MKPFPFHLTFRSAAWSLAGLLLFDFFWFRIAMPLLMSSPNTAFVVGGVVLSVALLVLHADLIWSLLDPLQITEHSCHFCDKTEEDKDLPEDWSTFEHGGGSQITSCGDASCRVAMAKSIASTLTFYADDRA